ncbi:LD-carboxypeptidase [Pseudovibrio japonicus]|uniref:LD-carboxypeptidase n=1 Tax=Pseudovibrio japonicus TaxID=366534 RepID=A0ABQ3ENE2_9HYPH|nr:S66 peptidase family protein [Pseudovibrio japonicus]GHB43039.1 LD-carboxypeptidase [Pseudovibrio japonicus]
MKYPKPLRQGSKIAITAFSSGVIPHYHGRLDQAIQNLNNLGYEVIEGKCLRQDEKHVSAPRSERAAELMRFLLDDSIDAIAPPWGGEFAIELLPLLDFEAIKRAKPKWVFGFSDVSTITVAITTKCGWATTHCANLMDMIPSETDSLTRNSLNCMQTHAGESVIQHSSKKYQEAYIGFDTQIDCTLNKTEVTQWKPLKNTGTPISLEGRLVGGCLDTVSHLAGTEYFNLHDLSGYHPDDGIIFYFENAELSPAGLVRTLNSLKLRGWFEAVNGILIGRNSGVDCDKAGLTYLEALSSVLQDYSFPIILDADIGHKQPNMALINGSYAKITVANGNGTVEQLFV